MAIRGTMLSIPIGTRLVGAIDPTRVVLLHEETIALVDLEATAIVARRTIPGARAVTIHDRWLAIDAERNKGPIVVRADLGGDERASPDGANVYLHGTAGGIGVFGVDFRERVRVDLETGRELDRTADTVRWHGLDPEMGLLFGIARKQILALRIADNTIAWKVKPFPGKVDDLSTPVRFGGALHVRASVLEEHLAARISPIDGATLEIRKTGALEAWLPDLGAEADRALARYRARRRIAGRDAIVLADEDQLIVVRASEVARLATPYLTDVVIAGDRVVGIATIGGKSELVIAPLPGNGEHDLDLEPRGEEEIPAGVPAVVTFVGATTGVVIVQHPEYGRLNLMRGPDDPAPEKGAEVILEGVEQKPGGVAKVGRWSVAGARSPRAEVHIALTASRLATEPAARELPPITPMLVARATEREVAIPEHVLRFVELVDRDASLRRALTHFSVLFDEDELGLDYLEDLDFGDFIPIWANGYGDGLGGLTLDGKLTYLHTKDREYRAIDGTLASWVRAQAIERKEEGEDEATADLVLDALKAL